MINKKITRLLDNHIVRIVLGAALILLIPLVAMQFSQDVKWGPEDFITIAILLLGTGMLYEVITKKFHTKNQRRTTAIILVLIVMYLWVELAVGLFTNWGS